VALKPYNLDNILKKMSICVLGQPGVGKTRMAVSTLPPEARVVILAAEDGLISVSEELRERTSYKVFEADTLERTNEAIKYFTPYADKIDYIVLDSAIALAANILRGLTNINDGRKKFAKFTEEMTEVMRKFNSMNCISIVTCCDQTEEAPDGSLVSLPAMQGLVVKNHFLSWFSCVFVLKRLILKKGDTERKLVSLNDDSLGWPGKCRLGKLPPMCAPNLSYMIKTMLGYLPGEKTGMLKNARTGLFRGCLT
jgi:hypothetical protein